MLQVHISVSGDNYKVTLAGFYGFILLYFFSKKKVEKIALLFLLETNLTNEF